MSGWAVVVVLAIVVAVSTAFWRYAPKQDQTVWRSSVILSLAMMFIFWAITYLCQLHPLVAPVRSDLRPEYAD